jgi:hypothetical protein
MLSPIALIHGTERCRRLAESAGPKAPTVYAEGPRAQTR